MLRSILTYSLVLGTVMLLGCGGGNSGGGEKSLSERQAIAMKMSNPDARATELVKIAEIQFASADLAGAKSSLSAAQRAVGEIEDNGARATTGIAIATALAGHDMEMEAKEVLKQVRQAIETDTNPATKANSLGRMALVYGSALKNDTAAEAYLSDAATLVADIPAKIDRVAALLEIGSAYHQIGRTEEAQAQFNQAVEVAQSAEAPREKTDLLVSIANRLQTLELADQAKPIRDEARTTAAAIEDDFSRGYALVGVAASYQAASDSTASASLLAEAEKAADKVADLGLKGELTSAIQRAKGF